MVQHMYYFAKLYQEWVRCYVAFEFYNKLDKKWACSMAQHATYAAFECFAKLNQEWVRWVRMGEMGSKWTLSII